MQEYDKRAAQFSFLKKQNSLQKKIRSNFPAIELITKKYNVTTDFEVDCDPDMPLDSYYTRCLPQMVFDFDECLIFSHPHDGKTLPLPQLILGESLYYLNEAEHRGSLARQIRGHMRCEHATERYLFKEVMKKRKATALQARKPLRDLHLLHQLEADLIPATKSPECANYILAWLKSQEDIPGEPHVAQRIRNVLAIQNVMIALKQKQ